MASGIYIVTIDSWTPVPVTQDKRYVDICARVDHTNVKVGKAKSLEGRHGSYVKDFASCNPTTQTCRLNYRATFRTPLAKSLTNRTYVVTKEVHFLVPRNCYGRWARELVGHGAQTKRKTLPDSTF